MTSRRPYWFSKTIKRRPCWCAKPVLRELNSFLMKTLSFVPINLHRHRPREWKRWLSIKLNTPHISLCYFWRYIDTSTLIKIICKLSPKLWVIHSVLLNMFLLLRFFSGFDLICLNLYSLIYATSSLISGLLISDLFLLFHALLVLNYTTTFNPLYYRKIFLMHFRLEQGSNVVFNHLNEKKFYRRHVCLKCTDFFYTLRGKRRWRYWCRMKICLFSSSFFIITIHNTTRKTNKIQCAVFLTSTSSTRKGSRKEVHYLRLK